MQIKPGDTVVLKLSGDQLTVSSLGSVIKRMQDKYRQPPGAPSAVDALIAERRREAEMEEQGR
jgi:hypothetical protein